MPISRIIVGRTLEEFDRQGLSSFS